MAEVIHRYVGKGDPDPVPRSLPPGERKKRAARRELDDDLIRERSKSVRSKRIMSDLLLAKARHELIPKEMVQNQAAYLFVALRQQLMQLPSTYARRILNISDIAKARAILTTAAHEQLAVLQGLSEKLVDPDFIRKLDDDSSA